MDFESKTVAPKGGVCFPPPLLPLQPNAGDATTVGSEGGVGLPPRLMPFQPHAGEATIWGASEADALAQYEQLLGTSDPEALNVPPSSRQSSSWGDANTLQDTSAEYFRANRGGNEHSVRLPCGAARRLSTHIPDYLRRGVRFDTALSGFGFHWASSGGLQTNNDDYELSEEVDDYDFFVSHDWWTRRRFKITALLVLFNSQPAALLAVVTATICGLAETFLGWTRAQDQYTLCVGGRSCFCPKSGRHSVLVSLTVFLVALCWWQRVRTRILRRPIMLFFDKLCISQADPDLKNMGILGLGGFLRHSKRLVVLWSPRYFSRLWCTFELAAWVHLRGDAAMVMPVNLAEVLLLHAVLMGTGVLASAYLPDSSVLPIDRQVIVLVLLFVLEIPATYKAGQHVRDLSKLPVQLGDFSIRSTTCFCCANSHTDPKTGQAIPCDRAAVYESVRDWFSDETDEDALDCFDDHVRNKMAPAFTAAMQGTKTMYILSVYTSGVVYWCWYSAWLFGAIVELGDVFNSLRVVAHALQYPLLVCPVGVRLMLRIASLGEHCVCIPLFVKVLFRSVLHALFLVASTDLQNIALQLENPIPQVAVTLGYGILTLCLFTSTRAVR